ncbi:2361_t:CDS:2 [Racocetra fulgida]|uniref:Phospholipid-transporting ATPase n=1 Tax=Racocetra fulgida TaxID=60492 RepID=A0A9N8W3G1_9GLOM|nr:2361_t:CDS:2 [Racocetra fulgida]
MYYPKLDYPCTPKTWNISDDLGQIEYIFSDKTGTLTQNVMEFRKCTINGVSYGKGETDTTRGAKLQKQFDNENSSDEVDLVAEKQLMLKEMSMLFDNQYMSSNLTFIDSNLFCDLRAENKQSKAIQDFFSALALCHTVLVEHPDENNPYKIEYKAQSPDEAALVGCARDVGFVFIERHQDTLTIELLGERKEFTLLNVLEFNSTRKRMSVILRSPEGSVILLCKGADSVIYERLEEGSQDQLKEDTLADLQDFANEGLRTLCIAYRVISDEEYNVWARNYAEASSSINDREEKVEQSCELIEHSLILMGGTAIEDRLQEGVPECIATLSTAGIKIWVLTGDKTETAINIDKQSTLRQLNEAMDKFFGPNVEACNKSNKHALIIDGETLKYALDESLKHLLLGIGKRCNSVICCRVSPLQKAKVVSLVKEGLNVMTLSIGDGANDVSMIQEANVGIGIAGEEGRQAVMAADYAFAQFRFLDKLLLVHGRAFDQDVDAKTSLENPPLYKRGILQQDFTKSKFWLYVLDAVYQSAICFFIPYGLFQHGTSHATGLQNNGLSDLGTLVAGSVVVTTNLYVVHGSKKRSKKKRENGENDDKVFDNTDVSLDDENDYDSVTVVDVHSDTDVHEDIHNDSSYVPLVTLDAPTKPRSMSKLPKLPKISALKKTRKDSIRSLCHMNSGKRQSFTGFAFSGEESAFEGFRRSVYHPKQKRILGRSHTFTSSSNNEKSEKSFLSVLNRSRTLPIKLFRRLSPNPSRATSPNRSSNDENGQGVRRRGNSSSEEVELSAILPS